MSIRGKREIRGFTLIEMLMVIIIIFMLSFLMFRLMKMLDQKSKVAQTVYVLKQVQNALNEYKLEYGIYPPVHVVEYEYESYTNQTEWFRNFLSQRDNPDITDGNPVYFFSDRGDDLAGDQGPRQEGEPLWTGNPRYPDEWHLHYRYGLVAHLDFRARDCQVHPYDADTGRDKDAKRKWACFMEGLVSTVGFTTNDITDVVATRCVFSNRVDSILDGFGNPIKYECRSPYTSYRLWSTSAGGIDSASVGGI